MLDPSCCNYNGKGFKKNATISSQNISGCDWFILKCVDKKGQPIIEVQRANNCTMTTKCVCPTPAQCNNNSNQISTTKYPNSFQTFFSKDITSYYAGKRTSLLTLLDPGMWILINSRGEAQSARIQFKGSKLLFDLENLYMLSEIQIDFT